MFVFCTNNQTARVHKNSIDSKVLLTVSDDEGSTRIAILASEAKEIAQALLKFAQELEEKSG